jgi:hypothetical protein
MNDTWFTDPTRWLFSQPGVTPDWVARRAVYLAYETDTLVQYAPFDHDFGASRYGEVLAASMDSVVILPRPRGGGRDVTPAVLQFNLYRFGNTPLPVPRFGAGFDISSPPDSRPHAERDDDRDYYRDIYRRYLRAKLSTPYAVYTVGVFAYDHD